MTQTQTHPAAITRDRNRRFGAGLFAFVPHSGKVGYTASEEVEYLAMVADRDQDERQARRDFNDHLEERAACSAQMDRVCRGPMF
jgi:hypothetical protein